MCTYVTRYYKVSFSSVFFNCIRFRFITCRKALHENVYKPFVTRFIRMYKVSYELFARFLLENIVN